MMDNGQREEQIKLPVAGIVTGFAVGSIYTIIFIFVCSFFVLTCYIMQDIIRFGYSKYKMKTVMTYTPKTEYQIRTKHYKSRQKIKAIRKNKKDTRNNKT